jgi:hypothetical protein
MRDRRREWRSMAAMLTAALIAGCGPGFSADAFREPRLHLDRVIVRGVGLTGGNLDLVVNVANPNRFDLRGTRLEAGFEVEGSHVGTVTYDDDYVVPRGDSTIVTLPLRFQWKGPRVRRHPVHHEGAGHARHAGRQAGGSVHAERPGAAHPLGRYAARRLSLRTTFPSENS